MTESVTHTFYIMPDEYKRFFLLNNNWDTNDTRFGGQYGRCNICNNFKTSGTRSFIKSSAKKDECVCTGHFAKLDLKMYIIHPLFESLYKKLCVTNKITSRLSLEKQRELLPEEFKGIIFRYMPIPHLGIRNTSDIEWDTVLTRLYNDLINTVKKTNPVRENIEKCVQRLFSKEGIFGLLSTKQGVFRKICFGKRLESSARSVITGDPHIDFDQVHIPRYLADFLYIECTVESNSIQYYIEKDIPLTEDQAIPGIKAIRKIQDDDIVLINRQPTLSYGSILGFRAKIRNDSNNTIGINPNITKTFNADFDGDEMNIFCFPQCDDLKKMHIVNFPECVNNIQDTVTGKYIFDDVEKYKNINNLSKINLNEIESNTKNSTDLYTDLTNIALTINLQDMIDGIYDGTDLERIISSGSKGNVKNKEQIMDSIGNQYMSGNLIGKIESNYIKGLNQEEFYIHQIAAREGIVSTGVSTAITGYTNRKATRSMTDVVLDKDGTIKDFVGVVSYKHK